MFETPVETDMELVTRIVAANDIIQNSSGIFLSGCGRILYADFMLAFEVDGRKFEQLLQDAKWYVNYVNALYLQVTVTNVNKK